jgi:hypothetical protein
VRLHAAATLGLPVRAPGVHQGVVVGARHAPRAGCGHNQAPPAPRSHQPRGRTGLPCRRGAPAHTHRGTCRQPPCTYSRPTCRVPRATAWFHTSMTSRAASTCERLRRLPPGGRRRGMRPRRGDGGCSARARARLARSLAGHARSHKRGGPPDARPRHEARAGFGVPVHHVSHGRRSAHATESSLCPANNLTQSSPPRRSTCATTLRYNPAHPWRPHRSTLVHSIVDGYDITSRMVVRRPRPRTFEELTRFHADGGWRPCVHPAVG